MCGICGFVGPGLDPGDARTGIVMRDLLEHRGPDGAGEYSVRGAAGELEAWFGHRRLKVIDLTEAAHQPMANEDGSVVLNYNGEIYNFRELREELEAAGHTFRSSGDTEVVLRAYEHWGDDFVRRIDGMFAIAVYDARQKKLVLARDRTGKKPLFYSLDGNRLAYASEIKSLLAAPWISAAPDLERIPEFLTFGYVPHPQTLYCGIVQVPPASIVVYRGGVIDCVRRYWDVPPAEPSLQPGKDVLRRIATLVADATKRRMISDVPLGALLSGGIDSSIVVGLMSRFSPEPVRTFTIGFPEEPSYDERAYARAVADHFGAIHTELAVEVEAVSLMEKLLWHHDQPYADSSALPTYLVSQLARDHVTVALNGDGGDEVFGGYDRFVAALLSDRIPRFLSRFPGRAARILPVNSGYYSLRRRAERFSELADAPTLDRYQSWIAVLHEDLLYESLVPSLRGQVETATRSMERWYQNAQGADILDKIMYANFKTYLPDDLAVKMDRMSMANSLEMRSPFLDTALVEYVARIPARRKIGVRRLKPILRRAFHSLLPKEVWQRKKHGFGVPVGRWFRAELGEMFRDEVLAGDARTRSILDQQVIERLWREHDRGEAEHGARLWTILTLEHWLRSVDGWRERSRRGPRL